jgi:tryptophan synthase alpha chain
LMGYMNPMVARGVDRFLLEASQAGADGLIVPDLSLDEADEVGIPAAKHGLDLILLAAPTTPADRLKRIGEKSRGFLYFVSVTGVTGARGSLPDDLPAQLQAARGASSVPVAVGFGIGAPDQAKALAAHADGIIVGSALVQTLHQANGSLEPALGLVRSLATALRTER